MAKGDAGLPCTFEGCDRSIGISTGFGLCTTHYTRRRRGQDMSVPIKQRKRNVLTTSGRDPKPNETAIYMLQDDSGTIWYIGQTTLALKKRLKVHLGGYEGKNPQRAEVLRHIQKTKGLTMKTIAYLQNDHPILNPYKFEQAQIRAAIINGEPLLNEVSPVLVKMIRELRME